MNKVLEWLRESFEDALDDRDEESNEGISLVPLTDDSSIAMETPSFLKLLRAFGVEPPANEQEIHWRIPATMLSATIRKRCELITNSLAGNFIEDGMYFLYFMTQFNYHLRINSGEIIYLLYFLKKIQKFLRSEVIMVTVIQAKIIINLIWIILKNYLTIIHQTKKNVIIHSKFIYRR